MSNTTVLILVEVFNNVLWSFSYVILPMGFILGNLGNCLNLIVFCQRTSRTNSCLLYFLSASIINILILNYGLVLRILRGIWSIDPAIKFVWFCRWRSYLTTTCLLIYRCSIVLACFDRMCASSLTVRVRIFARPKIAYHVIGITWILCMIYYIPASVFQVILYGQCISPPNSTYLTISTLIQSLLIPLLMIIGGIITITHIKTVQTRILPSTAIVHPERRLTRHFLVMLLIQVVTDCLCNIMYPIYLIFSLIYPAPQPTQIAIISSFLINMSFNLPYINYSASFYIHTLFSSTFRQKLFQLFQRLI